MTTERHDNQKPEALMAAAKRLRLARVSRMFQVSPYAPLQKLHASFSGARLEEPPRGFTAIALRFAVTGDIRDETVARAIELSRTRYCSALTSLREDIALTTTYAIVRE